MKFLITALALTSFSAFSAVELRGKIERANCTIKDGTVTKTQTFGKENNLGLKRTSKIETTGLDAMVRTAHTAARPHTDTDPDYVFEATVDGETFTLNMDDSKEAMVVVQLIVQACNYNN